MFEQNIVKHIGALASTGAKIVVVFMQLPDAPDKALIFDMDAIPRDLVDDLEKLIKSSEAQNSENLADILGRRATPRTEVPVLNWLHNRGYLKPVNISEIVMTPTPYVRIPLNSLLMDMKRVKLGLDASAPAELVEQRYKDHLGLADVKLKDHAEVQAYGLRKSANDLRNQAKLLMNEADKKDARAEEIMAKFRPPPIPTTPLNSTALATAPKKRGRKKKVDNDSNNSILPYLP